MSDEREWISENEPEEYDALEWQQCDCCGEYLELCEHVFFHLKDGRCICDECFEEEECTSKDIALREDHTEDGDTGEEELIEFFEVLFDRDDMDTLETLLSRFEDEYGEGYLDAEALLIAIRRGDVEYVSTYASELDLNDEDGFGSRFLDEAEDDEMREALIDAGANPNYAEDDVLNDARFTFLSYGEGDYSLDDSLRRELIELVYARCGITHEDLAEGIRAPGKPLPEPLDGFTYSMLQALLRPLAPEELPEKLPREYAKGWEMVELMEALDIKVHQEGQEGPHGHGGWFAYYVD